jgi:Zn-finger nucleic acid-binding protein
MLYGKNKVVELDMYIDYCPTCTIDKDEPVLLKSYGEAYEDIMSSTVKMEWFMKCPRCEQLFDGGDLYIEREHGIKSRSGIKEY